MSNPNTNSKLKTLCRTAIFLALLVAVQFVTRSMGQYVTGSLVNLILIASGLLCGLWGGLAVALLSPICAFLIGIGPAFPQIVPAIMLGNAVIVLVWHLIAGGQNTRLPGYLLAAAAGALAKFAVLYLVIVKWLVPMVLTLNEKQTAMLSASFSFPPPSAGRWPSCWCRRCAARCGCKAPSVNLTLVCKRPAGFRRVF